MPNIIINPGSGPVGDATEADAVANIAQLIIDSEIDAEWARVPQHDRDGRFGFVLWLREAYHYNNRCCFVRMPGIPLAQVRYMQPESQNIWEFPRLYINESSWVWIYAISAVKRAFESEAA